ncbi:MAG: hypothetical protein ABI648_08765 [Betaproteobacteria bacterium]
MNPEKRLLRLAVAGVCVLAAASVHAASGTVDLVLDAKAKTYAVQMDESTVTASAGNGTLVFSHSSGRPFVDDESAVVEYVGFSRTTPSGLELEADGVATFSAEDTLLLVFRRGSDDSGTSGEGNLQFTGGTGRFAGIAAQCRYRTDHAADDREVTVARCQWVYSFPYR